MNDHDANNASSTEPSRAPGPAAGEPYQTGLVSDPNAAATPPPDTTPPDWRELLADRRFNAAKQAFQLAQRLKEAGLQAGVGSDVGSGGEQGAGTDHAYGMHTDDPAVGPALAALADVEDLVRERSYLKASTRIDRLEQRPLLAPWQRLQDDLQVLSATSKALDRREPDAAIEGLESLSDSWFEADVQTQRGTAQIYLGEFDEARTSFTRALEVDPQHFRALTNLGNVALEQGEVDEAIDLYERALKLNDQFANAHHNLGVAYRRKGHVGKSVRSLRRAQRVSQRVETAEARESFTRWSGQNSQKYLKWLLYAAVGGALWWVLRSQGVI